MPITVSTINLKGGVGKTSITVALAEILSAEHGQKVLVIDLDPQTNATVMLIPEEHWKEKNDAGDTLFQMFRDRLEGTSKFDPKRAIMKRVSNVGGGIPTLDLLPSSLDLIEIQDALPNVPKTGYHVTTPVSILKSALDGTLGLYDFVLIDCPPNLGTITLNGLLISDYFLIPCIPDILSTYGISQILKRVEKFREREEIHIIPLGIVISMFRPQVGLHKSVLQTLNSRASQGYPGPGYPRVFKTMITHRISAAEAADVNNTVNTLRQKYSYGGIFDEYRNLASEFLSYVG